MNEDGDIDLDKAWSEFNPDKLPHLVRLTFETLKRLCDLVSESPEAQARVDPNHLWELTCWVLDVATGEETFTSDDVIPHLTWLLKLGQRVLAQTQIGLVFPDELLTLDERLV